MENGDFWKQLKAQGPIFALAPMEDVTDTVFRELVLHVSAPEWLQVVYTEFTSTDGLCHPVGRDKVAKRLVVSQSERDLLRAKGVKIVAQICGANPEKYHQATRWLCEAFEFDGIDINMGCPVRKIVKQGSCSALIGTPDLAREIVLATREASNLPVSVKTRTGVSQHRTEEWTRQILETGPAALVMHGRTQKQMSEVPADWDEIAKVVRVRDEMGLDIPIIGNGDVASVADGLDKIARHGVDGVMVGRGIFANPWFFNREKPERSPEQKLALLWKHATDFHKQWDGERNFAILRRFFKIYTHDFAGAAPIRAAMMETHGLEQVRQLILESPWAKALETEPV